MRNIKAVTPSELDGQPAAGDEGEGDVRNNTQGIPRCVDGAEMGSRDISRKQVDTCPGVPEKPMLKLETNGNHRTRMDGMAQDPGTGSMGLH